MIGRPFVLSCAPVRVREARRAVETDTRHV
jgi:hypothetical protein